MKIANRLCSIYLNYFLPQKGTPDFYFLAWVCGIHGAAGSSVSGTSGKKETFEAAYPPKTTIL